MLNLLIKSNLLCAYVASLQLAPMDVPERTNCLDNIYSFLFDKYLCALRILNAKAYAFSSSTPKLEIFFSPISKKY